MNTRIGIATGGGDCPGLNAVIRAVAKAAAKRGWETVGLLGGYEGLLEPRRFVNLDYTGISGLLMRGGTILGTANRGRFSAKTGHGETRGLPKDLLDDTKKGFDDMGLRASSPSVEMDRSASLNSYSITASRWSRCPRRSTTIWRARSSHLDLILPSPAQPMRWIDFTRLLRVTIA